MTKPSKPYFSHLLLNNAAPTFFLNILQLCMATNPSILTFLLHQLSSYLHVASWLPNIYLHIALVVNFPINLDGTLPFQHPQCTTPLHPTCSSHMAFCKGFTYEINLFCMYYLLPAKVVTKSCQNYIYTLYNQTIFDIVDYGIHIQELTHSVLLGKFSYP